MLKHIFYGTCAAAKAEEVVNAVRMLEEKPMPKTDSDQISYHWSKDKESNSIWVWEWIPLNKTLYSLPETSDMLRLRQEMRRVIDAVEGGTSKTVDPAISIKDIFYHLQQVLEDSMAKQFPKEAKTEELGNFRLSCYSKNDWSPDGMEFCAELHDNREGYNVVYMLTYFLSLDKNSPAMQMCIKAIH